MKSFSERIALILEHYNLQPKELAEKCNVQRSAISHLINGRNRPSVSFLSTLSDVYPELDTRWLLHGKGKMFTSVSLSYRDEGGEVKSMTNNDEDNSVGDTNVSDTQSSNQKSLTKKLLLKTKDTTGSRIIERVIVCYSDGTFLTYEH